MQTRWVRRPYHVRDGWIRPVLDGEPELYDPFAGYYHDRHPREGESAYLALAALNLKDERAIEGWVSRYGLLGLFQDGLLQVRHVDPGAPGAEMWTSVAGPDLPFKRSSRQEPYHPADSTVIFQDPTGEYAQAPAIDYFSWFFPGVNLAASALAALAQNPWEHLSEPLDAFCGAARLLREHIEIGKDPDSPFRPALAHWVNSRMRRARAVLQPPPVDNPSAPFTDAWVFPSLLSALYACLRQDLLCGRLRQCARDRCRRPFVARRDDKRHCSPECRHAQRAADKRAREKEERA